jgi:hypothetical protein
MRHWSAFGHMEKKAMGFDGGESTSERPIPNISTTLGIRLAVPVLLVFAKKWVHLQALRQR